MSIDINSPTVQKNIVLEQNRTQKHQHVDSQRNGHTVNNQDSVQITEQAQRLNNMQSACEPQVNTQRVETLKAAILNGDYKINTERLAEKLSKFESDFGKALS